MALAPIAVEPQYQNKGIGHKLIQEGIRQAEKLGYKSIIVVGHPSFYTKFGFKKASKWGIGIDEGFNSDYLFGLELVKGGLGKVNRVVRYCASFCSEEGYLGQFECHGVTGKCKDMYIYCLLNTEF